MKVSSQSGSSLLRRSRVGLLTKSICAALAISAMSLQASAEDAAPKAPVKPLEAAKTTEATPDAKGIVWVEDFEAAKALAAKEKKDLLIDFTGSDWCGWCIKLRKEVFDKPAFAVAAKDYIFVELDYPQQKKLDPKIKETSHVVAH